MANNPVALLMYKTTRRVCLALLISPLHKYISMATDLLYLACFTGNLESVDLVSQSIESAKCKDMQLAYAICILCGHLDIAEYLADNYEISGTFLSTTALHKLKQIRTFADSVIDIKKNVVNFDEFMELHPEADTDDEYDDNSVDEETSFDCSELSSDEESGGDVIETIKKSIVPSSSESDEGELSWASDLDRE